MKLVKMMKRFVKDERGLETVEYAIILGLIVIGVLVFIGNIGTWVATQFQALDDGLNGG